ncbi:MFS transporter permease [Desulfobacula sp.]|uniref:MFS transporter permease n=1 Tax=Desulfobacula sp. TaxID=2593537 RepID=UPI00260A478F|nr:MFS transporter permease [Desulfobacula sp.]
MSEKPREIIISKEDAVFWMDKNGDWHNEHGKFEHPKIIKYFNASIKKDKNGYYIHQVTDEYDEKVYFSYEDTALFVFDIKVNKNIILTLNNNDTIKFDPKQLFTRDDNLYIQTSEHQVKFKDRALLKISKFMEEKNGQLLFKLEGKTYPVQ